MNNPPLEDALPLDSAFFTLSNEESSFFKTLTGIGSDEELKEHILKVQAEAYKVHPYPCIRRFDFARLKISLHPCYSTLLQLGRERGGIFLDIGCCFGNDVRKAVLDGYPISNVLATDLRQEFWELGHSLFKSTPQTFPVPFLCGNIFDSDFLEIQVPSDLQREISNLRPMVPLTSLRSLTPLQGRVSIIHAAALFHLFDEESQLTLARRLASLLSSEPGSIIFGSQVSRPTKGLRTEATGLGCLAGSMFCHSATSWKDLWDGEVFARGTVHVKADLEEMHRTDLRPQPSTKYYQLVWSVTRL